MGSFARNLLAVFFGTTAFVAAQPQTTISPDIYGSVDAPSVGVLAGACADQRQQILVSRDKLHQFLGLKLAGVLLRRDGGGYPGALNSVTIDVVVTVSTTTVDPSAPNPSFAANRGRNPLIVYQGQLALPASPPLVNKAVPWDASHSFEIPFASPFFYTGDNLCIEIEGRSVGSAQDCYWPIDYEYTGSPGEISVIGQGCGSIGGLFSAYASLDAARVGNTLPLLAWGHPATTGVVLIGASTYQPPIDLGAIGALGCVLYVDQDFFLPVTFDVAAGFSGMGLATKNLQLPRSPQLAGSRLFVQWINNETGLPRTEWSNPSGLSTTNALGVTLSASLPELGVSTVISVAVDSASPLPSIGDTYVMKAPLVRFRVQ